MKIIKNKYIHYINNYKTVPVIIPNENEINLYIVYFINCLTSPNYFDWLKNQIDIVYNDNRTIYIIATLDINQETEFKQNVLSIFPNVIIECNYTDEHEYRGILKVWELGQQYTNTNDIILFFHAKDMLHANSYDDIKNNKYYVILKDMEKIKEIFNIFPSIDKVGYFSGGSGWIWYNFWYARGSYINKIEKPIKTDRMHYYEDWLSRKLKYIDTEMDETIEKPYGHYENTLNNCYGFYCDESFGNIGSYYDPNEDKMYFIEP